MNNFTQRTLTGIAIVGIMVACLLTHELTFALLFLAIMLGMLHEFFTITESTGFRPHRWIISGLSMGFFVVSFLVASGRISPTYFYLFFPALLITFAHELFANKKYPLQNIAFGLVAMTYITIPICLANYLVFSEPINTEPYTINSYSPMLFLIMMVIIWVYDTGAYVFGMSFGKHRLFVRVSPKKSWEGAIGGLISALAAGGIIAYYIDAPLAHWLIIAFGIVIASTLGDLTESLIKRQFGVKDSGTILPGHGGLLDRFDSILFAIPLYVCLLELLSL